MRLRRPIALACLLAAAALAPATAAFAQETTPSTTVVPPVNPGGDQLDGGVAIDPGTTPGGVVAPDDAQSLPPASTTQAPAGTTPGAGATPTPPPYLAPGPSAAVQPVSSVAQLTSPDVPLEPLRLAALIAALLAALLVGGATLVRTLGLRGAVAPVVPDGPPESAATRLRERVSTLADDVRDFLRHSR